MATHVNSGSAQAGDRGTIHREVSPEQRTVEQRLVDNVVASFDAGQDPQLQGLMISLVKEAALLRGGAQGRDGCESGHLLVREGSGRPLPAVT